MRTRTWEFESGELAITDNVLYSLAEQINALRIKFVRDD